MQAAQRLVEDQPRVRPARGRRRHGGGDVRTGEAFLVEFIKNGKAAKGECDWMGVLYPTEIELGAGPEKG